MTGSTVGEHPTVSTEVPKLPIYQAFRNTTRVSLRAMVTAACKNQQPQRRVEVLARGGGGEARLTNIRGLIRLSDATGGTGKSKHKLNYGESSL